MPRNSTHILTTHVGSLPGPADVWGNSSVAHDRLAEAVVDVVRHQRDIGVDIVNEGELTKLGGWTSFMRQRVGGLERASPEETAAHWKESTSASIDRKEFAEFYQAAIAKGTLFEQTGTAIGSWEGEEPGLRFCTGPITYTGQAVLQDEIDMLKAALGDSPASTAFLTTVAPASFEYGIADEYYRDEEKFLFAMADALAVEYETIAAAGIAVQIDDAFIPALWEVKGPEMGLPAYKKFVQLRLDALNHALRNVPKEMVRYHLCWGSWHGPHAHDIPLADIVDQVLQVKAGAFLIEAANVRHEHEWRVWQDVTLADDAVLMPGVVSHATSIIEHPDLVADRIVRFAKILGRERVIASTDCGLGSRCHPQIAWAKLGALVEGARRASAQLF